MKVSLKTKAGVVLVGFSVLAVWMLLAVQSVQAHESTVRLPHPHLQEPALPEWIFC